ncbi:MAG TPA: cytochrome c-type biogenesis protein [Steroidobacteraceae bacterium]
MRPALLLSVCALLLAGRVVALDATPPIPDPVLQQRYLALTHELRCVQCQNESLADSQVSLAADLRREVHEMILAGKTDEQIRAHFVARYGEFILFRPRMSLRNAWLWSAPIVLLVIGAAVAVRVLRRRRQLLELDVAPIDDESSGQ